MKGGTRLRGAGAHPAEPCRSKRRKAETRHPGRQRVSIRVSPVAENISRTGIVRIPASRTAVCSSSRRVPAALPTKLSDQALRPCASAAPRAVCPARVGRCAPPRDEFDVDARRTASSGPPGGGHDRSRQHTALRRASRIVATAEEAEHAHAVWPWPAPPGPVATHSRRSKTARASSQCWVWGFFRSGWRILKLWARARLSPPMISG